MTKKQPLYSHIMEYLKEKMKNGEFMPGDQVPTEHELAEQFGVSRITSKRALFELEREGLIDRKRGKGSFVKKMTAGSSEIKADPSQAGAMNGMISMIIPFNGPVGKLMDYIRGATDFLKARGYFLTIHTTNLDQEEEKKLLRNVPRQGVKGIIFYPSEEKNMDILYELCLNQFPLVTIDKYYECLSVSSVVSDNFNGGFAAASHLLQLGHRRIAYLAHSELELTSSSRNRFFGYCTALNKAGISMDSEIITIGDIRRNLERDRNQHYQEYLIKMLRQGVTAIQAENDAIAVQLLRNCMYLGIQVPGDLSVIGFDNTEISELLEIPLTTVAQNFYEIGRRAAELVIHTLENPTDACEKVTLAVQFIERQSSGAPKCG